MKVNTAACFILSGTSLWCLREERAARQRLLAGRGCAALVVLAASLTLGEHLLGANIGVDQVLMKQLLTPADLGEPGRMSVSTAFSFLLVGITLLRLDNKDRHGHRPALAFALVTATMGLLAFVGYLCGAKALYAVSPLSSMALHTAALFIVVSVGILCARPDNGPLGILTAQGIGSTMARRILPIAIVLPFLIGWVRMQGERAGFYGFEFGLAMFATCNVIVFTALIWLTAVSLNRTDAERRKSLTALRESEHRFRMLLD